jgi:hypothetical protein
MLELYKSRSKQRWRVGEVLNKVLQKRYPKELIDRIQNLESDGSDILTFDELMEWDLWPCYLTVYSECNVLNFEDCIKCHVISENEALVSKSGGSCLHDGTALMCTIADSVVSNMSERVQSGNITMIELDRISDDVRRKRIKKLCSAIGVMGIEEALDEKLSEARAFNRHRETLGHICDSVTDVHVRGTLSYCCTYSTYYTLAIFQVLIV